MYLQGCNGKAFLSKLVRTRSILNVYNVLQKYMDGFAQHLEPRACVGNNSVVFPPQLRCVQKNLTWIICCFNTCGSILTTADVTTTTT
jgi:hypothetical protein